MAIFSRFFQYFERARERGFTLIETLVAISVLSISIVAPMTLTAQSLSAAYYARDQITAFQLAQEAIEVIRFVRDGNVLKIALGTSANIFDGIPSTAGQPFAVDTTAAAANAMNLCASGGTAPRYNCPPLQTNGNVYAYASSCVWPTNDCGTTSGWSNTRFTRVVQTSLIGSNSDELRITVTVSWATGRFQQRSFRISEDLYRWVVSGSGV